MSEVLSKVEALNKKIEELMKKRTMTEAQKSVLVGNIKEKLAEYGKEYGVDLYNSDINACAKLVREEYHKIMNQIKGEYEKSSEVVSLIESGRVAEARKLLGVDEEVEEKPVEKETAVGRVTKASEEVKAEPVKEEPKAATPAFSPEAMRAMMSSAAAQVGSSREEEFEEESEEAYLDDEYVEDDSEMFFEEEEESSEAVKEEVQKEAPKAVVEDDDFGFDFDDDDDEEPQVTAPVKKEEGLTSVADAVKEVEEKKPVSDLSGGFSFEDDDDDVGFGFKDLLQGSKFGL